MDSKIKFLKQIPFFASFSDKTLKNLIANLKQKIYQKDDIIIRQGEPGDGMFIIVLGDVAVHIDDKKVAELSNNDFFGELSLIFSSHRSATVQVISDDVSILCFSKKAFEEFRKEIGDNEREEIARRIQENYNRENKYV